MNILISFNRYEGMFDKSHLIDFCEHVLKSENVPDNCEVSISFVDDQEIKKLNKEYRGIDSPTDVLSFECDGSVVEEGSEICMLGDIVIAPDVAKEQCDLYENSFICEIELLLCHGILHLLGYDHIVHSDALVMEKREREIIDKWEMRDNKIVHRSSVEPPLALSKVFKFAFEGLSYCLKSQRNLKIHIIIAILVLILGIVLGIGTDGIVAILLCTGLVMSLELINTSIESVVDLVTQDWKELAKHAKDCAAGAVLIASIVSVIVGLIIFIPHILKLFA